MIKITMKIIAGNKTLSNNNIMFVMQYAYIN